jgi:hypothetical protein
VKRGQARLHRHDHDLSRRAGRVAGRRFAFLIGLVSGVLVASPAAIADSPLVTATIYGLQATRQDSVSVASLQADTQRCPEYSGPGIEQHGRNSTFTPTLPAMTWTLPTLLGCLDTPVSLSNVTAVTVLHLDGSPQTGPNSQLLPADLTTPSDFDNSAEGPVVAYRGSTIEYYRPWRGSNDRNADDSVGQPNGSPIAIEVFEGPRLTVAATASDPTPAVGTAVTFSASVSPSSGGLSYDWSFDGVASDSTAPSPQMTFSKSGPYDITVRVVDPASGAVGTAAVPITVGTQSPPQSTTTSSTPPPTTPGTTTPPPAKKGGGSQPRAGSGTSPTGSTKNQGAHTKHPRGNGGKSPASTTTTTSTTPGAQPPTTHAASATTSGAGSGASGSGAAHTTGQPHASPAPHSTKPVRGPALSPATPHPQEPVVAGQLVSDVTLLPAGASPLVHVVRASTTPAAAAPHGATAPVLAVTASAITILVLLSLGAARELRGRRDWLTLRFGS